jgi:hypothetical protein
MTDEQVAKLPALNDARDSCDNWADPVPLDFGELAIGAALGEIRPCTLDTPDLFAAVQVRVAIVPDKCAHHLCAADLDRSSHPPAHHLTRRAALQMVHCLRGTGDAMRTLAKELFARLEGARGRQVRA